MYTTILSVFKLHMIQTLMSQQSLVRRTTWVSLSLLCRIFFYHTYTSHANVYKSTYTIYICMWSIGKNWHVKYSFAEVYQYLVYLNFTWIKC